ncbi:MAG TPA: DUF2721 domain-containing protein [Candidatus Angelobacter sp.]|jgi:Protein of unknown function (DUF2721)|nr:DUF2721 domain-containing protein [Candidatus Angelobacter sp.]
MITPVSESPFAVLTLIAAPAVFTNASSVLALGTGNRLARVVDRTRQLVRDLHGTETGAETKALWMSHLVRLEQRGALLVRALSFFYTAIGCFAAASVVSILGASAVSVQYRWVFQAIVAISFILGAIGFVGLSAGCSFLVNETRLALRSMNEEAQMAKSWSK